MLYIGNSLNALKTDILDYYTNIHTCMHVCKIIKGDLCGWWKIQIKQLLVKNAQWELFHKLVSWIRWIPRLRKEVLEK